MRYFYVLQAVEHLCGVTIIWKKSALICKKCCYLLFNAVLLAVIAEINYSFSSTPKNYQKSNPG